MAGMGGAGKGRRRLVPALRVQAPPQPAANCPSETWQAYSGHVAGETAGWLLAELLSAAGGRTEWVYRDERSAIYDKLVREGESNQNSISSVSTSKRAQ